MMGRDHLPAGAPIFYDALIMTFDRPHRFIERWLRRAAFLALGLAGCGPSARNSGSAEVPRAPGDARSGDDAARALAPGTLQVSWIHGSQDCQHNTDPEIQV